MIAWFSLSTTHRRMGRAKRNPSCLGLNDGFWRGKAHTNIKHLGAPLPYRELF